MFSADSEEILTDIRDLKLPFFIRNILETVKTYMFGAPYLVTGLLDLFVLPKNNNGNILRIC